MRSYHVAALVLFLLSACVAQQAVPSTYTVAGTIINQVTGAPLPRVLVQLSGRAMLTGAEGEFSFTAVTSGRTQITISKPGFFVPGATHKRWSPPINVDVGADSGKLLLKLLPEAVISGTVLGKDDEPLEGAMIEIFHFMAANGARQLAPVEGNVRTDEDGMFRMAGLPADRYYVAVKAGNVTRRILGAQTLKKNETYPGIVYYPGTQDFEAATALNLAAGQHTDVQFTLALGPAFKIAGTLTAPGEWKQLNPPAIMDASDQVLFMADQFDQQTGQFEFRAVPAGKYKVRLMGMDQDGQFVSSRRTLSVSRVVTDLKLSLNPGIDIPVVVRTEFSKPRPVGSCTFTEDGKARQSDCSDFPAARVDLISSDLMPLRFSSDFSPAKANRPFALHHVAAGRYMVTASAMFGGYIQSLRSGAVDLLRDELVVPETGSVAPIEVVVRDDSGMLRIHVQTSGPGQTGTVLLVADGVLREPVLMGSAGGNADLQTGPLAPGAYKVFAFDSVDALDYRNPETLAKYASRASSVTVAADGNASVSVDLIRTVE